LFLTGIKDDGFVDLDEALMQETFELYEPGKPGVLWNSPPVVHAADLFSAQVQGVKDKLHDTDFELQRDWPNASFKEIASPLLIGSGVLFGDADRSRNPYKRSLADQVEIGKYVGDLVGQWLYIRVFIELEELTAHVDKLRDSAKSVGDAMCWTVQKDFVDQPIFVGPITASDVMRAGFCHASAAATEYFDNSGSGSGEDMAFSWGE
jgi:hypothetical protein